MLRFAALMNFYFIIWSAGERENYNPQALSAAQEFSEIGKSFLVAT